jgi:hypothetical protein
MLLQGLDLTRSHIVTEHINLMQLKYDRYSTACTGSLVSVALGLSEARKPFRRIDSSSMKETETITRNMTRIIVCVGMRVGKYCVHPGSTWGRHRPRVP